MPSFISRLLGRAPEAKDSRAGALLALHSLGFARWTTRNAVTLTQAGYERNAVVFRAVRMIAEAAASIPWLVFEGRRENPDHPLADLIAQPNAGTSGIDFFEALFSNLLLFGNSYVEAVSVDNLPREFHSLRPDRMSVVPGRGGWPASYDYTVAGQKVRYDMEVDGVSPILHLKCFHPLDDYYGFPPIAAAQVALDTHNAAGFWNKALLDNAARPSGALVYTGADGGHLTELQFERLKRELEENFSGALNAGRPLLLEGGLDWKVLSLSPKDMDFIEAKAAAAREIALAFGVPPLVLGLPGDNTFANYAEANRAFWRQTVIPLVARTQKQFAAWLRPAFEPFRFDYDVDRIDALAADRESEWRRIDAASFLTQDEKREAVGYGALPRGGNAGASQDNTGPSS
jgi:HK97 family phage portal protein